MKVSIPRAELDELVMYRGIHNMATFLITGHINHLSHLKYNIPPSMHTRWMPLTHAADLDIVDWGRRCCQDACPCEDTKNWISPTGGTSLYGALVPELCRRLEYWAYRQEQGKTAATQKTGRVEV